MGHAFAQSHTGTGVFSDDDSFSGGALTCESYTAEVAKLEKKIMQQAKQPYQTSDDFFSFIDNYFFKENLKILSISLPFTKLKPKCDCDSESLHLLKKLLKMYKKIALEKWSCGEGKKRVERVSTIEKIIKYYDE